MPRGRRRRRPKKVTSQPSEPSRPSTSNVNVVVDDDGGGFSPPWSSQPTIELYELIYRKKLDEASMRCRDFPQDARWKGYKGSLPIHVACDYGTPLSIIQQLHEAYREGVRTADDSGWLPLHIACTNGSLEVIKFLHCLYPNGATKKDNYFRTPVDRLDHNKKLSEEDKETVRGILSNPPGDRTPSAWQQPTTSCTPAEISTTTLATAVATKTTSSGAPHSHGTPSRDDEVDVANPAAESVAADEGSEGASSSTEGLEAAEAEAGAAADSARKAWEEAARKHAVAKEAARFGRRKAEVTDWNAKRLRREAEVARGNVQSTAVAASNAMVRKCEQQYKVFAKERDKLKLPFFEEPIGHRSLPSVDRIPEYVNDCTSDEQRMVDGDFR